MNHEHRYPLAKVHAHFRLMGDENQTFTGTQPSVLEDYVKLGSRRQK